MQDVSCARLQSLRLVAVLWCAAASARGGPARRARCRRGVAGDDGGLGKPFGERGRRGARDSRARGDRCTAQHEVAAVLLARHGIYVRDCADKQGLQGDRYLRVAARSDADNRRIVAAFADVLSEPVRRPLAAAA